MLNWVIACCLAFRTNWSFDDDGLICARSFHKLLEIWKERFMNFELGILKMLFYLKRKVYKIWSWNWKRKFFINGIYEFLKWNWNWKMSRKWNSWILNLELICQWFDHQMICHEFDQQLLFINVDTFWTNGKKNEICEFLILELENLEFWFWNFAFGIQMSKTMPAKRNTKQFRACSQYSIPGS